MGGEVSRGRRVGGAAWWLTELLAGALGAEEREAVLGDLMESGEHDGRGLRVPRQMAGLVVRRQAALWQTGRPWLALGLIGVPFGLLLALTARSMADASAVYLWFFTDNLDSYLVRDAGFWRGLMGCVPGLALSCTALLCWSWTSGLLLAWLARRAALSAGALFCLVLLVVGLSGASPYPRHALLVERARAYQGNDVVFTHGFYRVLFPLLVLAVLVVLPSIAGLRASRLPRLEIKGLGFVLWGSAAATVVTLLTQEWLWWQIRVWTVYPLRSPRLPSLLPFAVLGPAGYLLAVAGTRWRQRRQNFALER